MQGQPQFDPNTGGIQVGPEQFFRTADALAEGVPVHTEGHRGRLPLAVRGQPSTQRPHQIAWALAISGHQGGSTASANAAVAAGDEQGGQPVSRQVGEPRHWAAGGAAVLGGHPSCQVSGSTATVERVANNQRSRRRRSR